MELNLELELGLFTSFNGTVLLQWNWSFLLRLFLLLFFSNSVVESKEYTLHGMPVH